MNCVICFSESVSLHPAYFSPFIINYVLDGSCPEDQGLRVCGNCGHQWSAVFFTGAQHQKLYSTYRSDHYVATRKKYDKDYQNPVSQPLDVAINISKTKRILDYGGGDGARTRHWEGKKDIYDFGKPVKDGSLYDFVVCSHVLEHVNSPDAAIKEIKGFLHRLGMVYIEVPAYQSSGLDKPRVLGEHLHFFSVDSLQKLLEKHLEVISVKKEDSCLKAWAYKT